MKFAFIYTADPDLNTPLFTYADNGEDSVFVRVRDVEQACKVARVLVDEGYNLIELCGAFNEEGANKVIEVVNDQAVVGYVTKSSKQEELFNKLFVK